MNNQGRLRREDIELIAYDILKKLNLLKEPIELSGVLKHYNISLYEKDLDDDVSGFLHVKDNKPVIVNENHHPNRKRFTVAHELGHFFIHAKNTKDALFIDKNYSGIFHRNQKSTKGTDDKEIEANIFAAAFLMPKQLLKKALDNNGYDILDDSSFYVLAKRFSVSQQALAFRMAKLDFVVG